MNLSGISRFNQARIEWAIRLQYSPMPELDMDVLATQLNAARIGDLRQIGKTWEIMMERDGELAVNSDKRKSDMAGLEWQIVSDGSPDGDKHAAALQYFYDNLTATAALDQDDTGGVDRLIYQVGSAIDNKYSGHEMLLRIDNPANREVTAEFRHTPLWFFETRRGYMAYLQHIFDVYGVPCVQGEWLTAVNIGWMRPLSMAYAMKMFPLRDWLLFCTRYGSGFLVGETDANYMSKEWEQAQEALNTLANDGAVLVNKGVNLKFLEQSARNSLPFHPIVEMIDRLYAKCYRGVDLATSSRGGGNREAGEGGGKGPVGASVQHEESGIFLLKDARWITGVFNERIDRPVVRYLFKQEPRAWFVLMPPLDDTSDQDLLAIQALVPMGFKVMLKEVYKRFRWSIPERGEPCLTPPTGAGGNLPPGQPGSSPNETEPVKPDPAKKSPVNPDPKAAAAVPPPEPAQPKLPTDAAGEVADPLLREEKGDNPTVAARTQDQTPIAAGADPARNPGLIAPGMAGYSTARAHANPDTAASLTDTDYRLAAQQSASPQMPDPQVDAASFWSRSGLLPKGADGETLPLPSLGYSLPNERYHVLNTLGMGQSRAAQALRRAIHRRADEMALANASTRVFSQHDLAAKIQQMIEPAVTAAFLDSLKKKKTA